MQIVKKTRFNYNGIDYNSEKEAVKARIITTLGLNINDLGVHELIEKNAELLRNDFSKLAGPGIA